MKSRKRTHVHALKHYTMTPPYANLQSNNCLGYLCVYQHFAVSCYFPDEVAQGLSEVVLMY